MSDRDYEYEGCEQFHLDQQSPQWITWQANLDFEVAAFVAEHLAVVGNEPWSRDGLVHAELAATRFFPTRKSLWLPERLVLADQFGMYLGEVLRRKFRGEWINLPGTPDWGDGLGPTIRFPFTNLITEVRDSLVCAVQDRGGQNWPALWDDQLRYLREWRKLGCPPRTEWEQAGWVPPEDLEGRRGA
ncbi:hypothetical protein AB0H76_09690 [Nocardia sp. NPDC050712]|uniref:hypothetical protein n=1 Tax=Nocardia sp. NPDC050712 TaxID=3155518 RepID=UPI0033E598B7